MHGQQSIKFVFVYLAIFETVHRKVWITEILSKMLEQISGVSSSHQNKEKVNINIRLEVSCFWVQPKDKFLQEIHELCNSCSILLGTTIINLQLSSYCLSSQNTLHMLKTFSSESLHAWTYLAMDGRSVSKVQERVSNGLTNVIHALLRCLFIFNLSWIHWGVFSVPNS